MIAIGEDENGVGVFESYDEDGETRFRRITDKTWRRILSELGDPDGCRTIIPVEPMQ